MMTQKNKTHTLLPVLVTSLSALFLSCAVNAYDAGDVIVRAGPTNVSPDDRSSSISINDVAISGTGVDVEDDTQLGIVATYMISNQWGVSLLASTPFKHDIKGENIGIDDIGSIKHLPPTLTIDYFPLKNNKKWQPHIGIGVNYTTFFSGDTSSELNNALGKSNLELDDSVGLAIKLGLDYQFNDKFGINATMYRLDINSDATIDSPAGQVSVDVDIDPYVYMIGANYKF